MNKRAPETMPVIPDLESDYIVVVNDRKYYADTPEDVRDLICNAPFGAIYTVISPKGKAVSEFIPF